MQARFSILTPASYSNNGGLADGKALTYTSSIKVPLVFSTIIRRTISVHNNYGTKGVPITLFAPDVETKMAMMPVLQQWVLEANDRLARPSWNLSQCFVDRAMASTKMGMFVLPY